MVDPMPVWEFPPLLNKIFETRTAFVLHRMPSQEDKQEGKRTPYGTARNDPRKSPSNGCGQLHFMLTFSLFCNVYDLEITDEKDLKMKKIVVEEFCDLCPNSLTVSTDARPSGRLFLKKTGESQAISIDICPTCYAKMEIHFFKMNEEEATVTTETPSEREE